MRAGPCVHRSGAASAGQQGPGAAAGGLSGAACPALQGRGEAVGMYSKMACLHCSVMKGKVISVTVTALQFTHQRKV